MVISLVALVALRLPQVGRLAVKGVALPLLVLHFVLALIPLDIARLRISIGFYKVSGKLSPTVERGMAIEGIDVVAVVTRVGWLCGWLPSTLGYHSGAVGFGMLCPAHGALIMRGLWPPFPCGIGKNEAVELLPS